ncbi:MAG: glycosyltransferase family 4 protein [Candidatus Brocadiaceae bacterium]|nr:glycosyltransferase family 4 protein [Candidatus Brocadiaceae bacterium]
MVIYQFIKERGGVERYAFDLSEQLLDKNYEIHIFTHKFDFIQRKKLYFHYVPAITFWSPLKYWTFAVNVPKAIKKTGIKFDLIHGLTQTLSQDIYRVGGGCHWEYMMHTYPLMQCKVGKIILCLNPRHFSLLLLEKIIFKKNKFYQITCISEQCKREIMHHYDLPSNKIEVIYNGVNITLFTPRNKQRYREIMRKQFSISPDKVLLLFVGSGFKRKGLKHVINALPLITNRKKIKVLVAGKGNTQHYYRLALHKGVEDIISFTGIYKHTQELYAAADIFVFPSEYDAFGTACLEAMASEIPVITSETSGVSEIITNGKDGFILNYPIAAKELAKYIQILLEKKVREKMGKAARQKAEMYSFETNAKNTLRVYRKVLDSIL